MKRLAWLLVFLVLTGSASAQANTCKPDEIWRVSIAQLPGLSDDNGQGALVDFISSVADRAGVRLVYETLPFSRSLVSVANGKADLQIPFLELDNPPALIDGVMYSDVNIFEVPFAIYTKAGRNVSVEDLMSGSLAVETGAAHANMFPFPVSESNCLECALTKVQLGRLDAFVYARPPMDAAIRQLGLENEIEAVLYKVFNVKAVLPQNACGTAINRQLSRHVRPVRAEMSDPLFKTTN